MRRRMEERRNWLLTNNVLLRVKLNLNTLLNPGDQDSAKWILGNHLALDNNRGSQESAKPGAVEGKKTGVSC